MLTTFPKPPLAHRAGPPAFIDPRHGSLVRGSLLVLGSFIAVMAVSGLSADHAMPLLVIPAVLGMVGMLDTARCMHGRRWSLYEGGVYFLLLMDLMAMCLILFFLITPYVI
jgi:hypothetical protein